MLGRISGIPHPKSFTITTDDCSCKECLHTSGGLRISFLVFGSGLAILLFSQPSAAFRMQDLILSWDVRCHGWWTPSLVHHLADGAAYFLFNCTYITLFAMSFEHLTLQRASSCAVESGVNSPWAYFSGAWSWKMQRQHGM